MQIATCEGQPIYSLSTRELQENARRIDEIEFNDLAGHTLQSAREVLLRDIELVLRIRNMGLSL